MNTARFLALRVLLLVAMASSAMLAADAFSSGDTTFCTGEQSGCEVVRLSPLSEPFGVPLAYIGLAVFAGLMALTFGGPRVAPIVRLSLLGAGLGGLGLLAYQAFGLKAFCELCVVVDVSIVLAAAVGLPKHLSFPASPMALPAGAWLLLSVVAIATPGIYERLPEARPVPEFVQELQAGEGLTVVEVADFGCRHCRTLQRTMESALEGRGSVDVVRVIVPLTRHRLGETSSRIYRCAERHGVADELARLLSDDVLFEEGLTRWLAEFPEHEGDLRECMNDGEVRARVSSDLQKVRAAGLTGIPMTYVGGTSLRGAVSESRIVRAVRLESFGITEQRPSLSTLGLIVLGLVALIVIPAIAVARRRSRD